MNPESIKDEIQVNSPSKPATSTSANNPTSTTPEIEQQIIGRGGKPVR